TMRPASFVAECDKRVDTRGAASRKPASQQDERGQDHDTGAESERVEGAHMEQDTGQEACQGEGASQSEDDAVEGQPRALHKDEREYVLRAGAESDADADFLAALRDEIGDDAIDADRSQEQREHCKGSDEGDGETARSGRICDDI